MRISLIVVAAMFGIFLTFAIYGIITFDLSIQEMRKLLGTRNEGFAFNVMQDLDQFIDKRMTDFKDITKLNTVQNTLKKSNEEFRKFSDIRYFMTQQMGVELEESPPPFMKDVDSEEITKELRDFVQFYKDEYDYDVVEELYITNEYGANIVLETGIYDYERDLEEWWQTTKNTGSYIGKLVFREEYESYVIEFGFRIDDNNGNFLGVLRVVLTLDDMIHDFINDAEIINLPNRNVILLDEQGRVIYSLGIQDFSKNQPLPYFTNIVNGEDVGTLEITDEKNEVRIISYAKSTGYKNFGGFNWVVLVDQTSSSFVDEFVELRNSILTVSIIGMAASVLIGIIVSFFISNPLKELSKMADSISKGKFSVKEKKSKIDEIKVIENSFNEMSQSLQKLIETEKKLAEAQARVKNERLTAIGEISASMAHSMKNPLGTIQSSADIIKRNAKGKSEELDQVLARMDRAVDRMSRQIEDVLNFVRVTPLNVTTISIKEILDGAIESINIPKNVSIESPQTNFQIKCDPKKIEIVFINLILNAIQSIGNEYGKITIRIQEKDDYAIIDVEDSGAGISEEILPKIFEPLVTTKEKGTGLGLSTCKNIIEQHGGFISVKNNPTTFTIKFPLNE